MRRFERGGGLGCLLGGAVAAAPLIALLLGAELALGVAALALSSVAWVALDAACAATERRRVLVVAAVANVALALLCLGALVVRLRG